MEKLGKVMDKVIGSHGILKASKSMNPENLYSLPNIFPFFFSPWMFSSVQQITCYL